MRGRKCIKCGGKHGSPKFCYTGNYTEGKATELTECLVYPCATCGYEIKGPCLDSPDYAKEPGERRLEPADDGKVTDERWPSLRFTTEERRKITARYKDEDLPMVDGLELLEAYATQRPQKFAKYKSHYRTMVGWVLESVREREIKRMQQERNRNYLEGSRR